MNGGDLTRRAALFGGGALAAAIGGGGHAAATAPLFSWERLRAEALRLARRPWVAPASSSAAAVIDYDALNRIRYRADRTLLGGGAPGVRLFPLSRYAATPVDIALVRDGRVTPLPFARDLFEGGDRLPLGAEGFSGFRLMTGGGRSDWLAFQGASYFRAAGALDQYGLSARALAIDTGLGTPEEFPRFTRFWLEPGAGGTMTVYALLEGPSVAGAWRSIGRRTEAGVEQEVSLVFQLRRDVHRLGVAPLTSMFWYGEGDRARAIDWRPEIHDSDGLAMLTGRGERIWRPLANPPHALTNSFADDGPRGFGLLQRDRAFDHYQDDGVFYEKRPSLWVEPRGTWGAGAVTLVELPTVGETMDNIVAFWQPAAPARAGLRYAFDYRLRWIAAEPEPSGAARVVDTWRGIAGAPGREPIAGATRLVADFAGAGLKGLDRTSNVVPEVTLAQGAPLSVAAYPVAGAGERWRLVVDVAQAPGQTVDLRAYLKQGTGALTETLLYQFL